MIEKHIGSISSYIEFLNEITNNPDIILKNLIENSEEALDLTLNQFEYNGSVSENKIERDYLNIIFAEECKHYSAYFTDNDMSKNELNQKSIVPNFKFYYRGHFSNKYLLLPSAFRGIQEYENELYREILTRNPNDFVQCGHMNRLVKMQHYECPTRLLDITSNPLVALYFACKNAGCKKCDNCKTGEVFVFAPFEKDVLSYDSDKALILACLPKFTVLEKKKILEICVNKIKNKQYTLVERDGKVIERLYHEIKREVPSFKSIINPYDILSSFFVQPLKDNNRIIKQDGAFIICGQYYDSAILEAKLKSLLVAKIKVTSKDKILKELDALGINEATLFPELDKVAHYLKEKYK